MRSLSSLGQYRIELVSAVLVVLQTQLALREFDPSVSANI